MSTKEFTCSHPAGNFRCAAFLIMLAFSLSFGKTDLLVFLLSGQSNMCGAGLVSELPAELNKPQDSVLIYLASEGDASKKGKWMTLEPGFGSSMLPQPPNQGKPCFGPELVFGKTLSDSLPGIKIAIIKDAVSGTALDESNNGWRPPSSGGTVGSLYSNMMSHIKAALGSLDTSKYTIHMAGFVWLQGEFDAMKSPQANAYETNLTNLIKDIRDTLNTEDLPIILPMIDAQSIWTQHAKVRAADIALCSKLKNVDTLDTKGFETDGIHYKAPGVIKIGRIAAERWLNMHYFAPVPVISVSRNTMRPVAILYRDLSFYDCAGRKINLSKNRILNGNNNISSGFLLIGKNNAGYFKKLNVVH